PGPGARAACGVRPALCRAQKPVPAPVEGGVLPVRVARGRPFRRGWPRPSYVYAIFSADRAVSVNSLCGGALRYRLPRPRSGPPALARASSFAVFRPWVWTIAILTTRHELERISPVRE